MLALAGARAVTADAIADELWQGEPPDGFRTTVRSYVSRLRHVLGEDSLESAQGSSYTLRPGAVDAEQFELLVAEGDEALEGGALARARDLHARALRLWRGPALADVSDSGRTAQRGGTARGAAPALRRAAVRGGSGPRQGPMIVEQIESMVRRHPFRERLWRQLMLALYHSERQADALEAFQRARRALVEELGIEPSVRLRELHQSMLRHDLAPVVPPEQRHNLPAQISEFIGREAELGEVLAEIESSSLVTLTGVGGVGKTRMALESARRALLNFPGGVFFCDLAGLGEPALVPVAVGRALGAGEAEELGSIDTMVTAVGDSEALLLIDNCEHLRQACAELADSLLSACPRLRILATSRAPLGVTGEVDYPIPPMSLEPKGEEVAEAVELFLSRARASRPHLVIDAASLESASLICADLDGLPLAIELAAARAKMLSLDEIATHLTDRFRFLVSWRRLTPARHQTLAEAMAWSYALLSAEERAFFARLSVFRPGSRCRRRPRSAPTATKTPPWASLTGSATRPSSSRT